MMVTRKPVNSSHAVPKSAMPMLKTGAAVLRDWYFSLSSERNIASRVATNSFSSSFNSSITSVIGLVYPLATVSPPSSQNHSQGEAGTGADQQNAKRIFRLPGGQGRHAATRFVAKRIHPAHRYPAKPLHAASAAGTRCRRISCRLVRQLQQAYFGCIPQVGGFRFSGPAKLGKLRSSIFTDQMNAR